MRVAIVAMMKNEERYILDWVKWHAAIGITDFILLDNNDEGNTGHLDILKPVMSKYNIQLVDLRGRENLERIGFQIGAYNWAYDYIRNDARLRDIDYVAFIDIDEYLYFYGKRIQDFLLLKNVAGADLIQLNWQCYGDNDLVYYDARPVWRRFTRPAPVDVIFDGLDLPAGITVNNHVKSILKVSERKVTVTVHTTMFGGETNVKCINSLGYNTDWSSPFQNICYTNGLVRHYVTKTAEEFIQRRIKNYLRADLKNDVNFERAQESFFRMNATTMQKIKLFEQARQEIQNK